LPALLTLALAFPCGAAAGEGHGTDLFAGYSFAKLDETSRHGANLAAGFDLVGPLSGFVDLSSHWGSESGVSLNDLTLMAGPGVRFGKRGGTVLFVRAMAGLLQDKGTISVLDVDISEKGSRFAILAGGGVDFRVGTALALRIQGDYLGSDAGAGGIGQCPAPPPGASGGSCQDTGSGGWSSDYRVSAGVVYRFGNAR
jgi:hypothetical protein